MLAWMHFKGWWNTICNFTMIEIRIWFLQSDISSGEVTLVTLLCFNMRGASSSDDLRALSFRDAGCGAPCWKVHCPAFHSATMFVLKLSIPLCLIKLLCVMYILPRKESNISFLSSFLLVLIYVLQLYVSYFSLGLKLNLSYVCSWVPWNFVLTILVLNSKITSASKCLDWRHSPPHLALKCYSLYFFSGESVFIIFHCYRKIPNIG